MADVDSLMNDGATRPGYSNNNTAMGLHVRFSGMEVLSLGA
jgi:hypothetical protein